MVTYTAQANILSGKIDVNKGGVITEEIYNSLPEGLRIKFIPSLSNTNEPEGRDTIIGDTPVEKTKRDKLLKEYEFKKKSKKRK